MTDLLELHQSTLVRLSGCGYQAYLRDVLGLPERSSVPRVVGTAVHRGAREDLERKRDDAEPRDQSQVADEAADHLRLAWESEEVVLDEGWSPDGARGAATDQAVSLSLAHHVRLLPRIEPTHVERRLEATIEKLGVRLVGTLDCQEGDRSLRDLKTSAARLGPADADASVQGDIYALLLHVVDGRAPARFWLDVLRKGRTPEAYSIPAPLPSDHGPALLRIELAARSFQSGVFYPTSPDGPSGWRCSRDHCGFWEDRCPFGRRARKTVRAAKVES